MSPGERLVGRESVLTAARSVFRDAVTGSGQLMLISGEAGIGKTAVLAALLDDAARDCTVLRGLCWEGAGAPPYWPWSQVLLATGLPVAELGEAGRLLQTDSGPTEVMDAGAAADAQFRVFESVTRCLAGLATRRPLFIALDDLHWADEPSVRLLGFLARALSGSRVLLVGAYRETESSAELLALAAGAHHLPLAGLGEAEVAALAAGIAGTAPSARVSSDLWQRSGGNPFFVRELTRLLMAQGSWAERPSIPGTVAETLRRRLARLPTGCVRLLDWAAVAGRDIEIGLLVQVGAVRDEAEALDLLDDARRAGVVVGTHDEPRFAHDLYRETILLGLRESSRADLNFAVGRALQARSAATARIASHLLAAGPAARRQAIDFSVRAAREATARLGHDDACVFYRKALRLLEMDADEIDGERCAVLLELAAAQIRAGDAGRAEQNFRDAADRAGQIGDAVLFANAVVGLHSLGHRFGAARIEILEMLRAAEAQLAVDNGPLTLRSQVIACQAREMRHRSNHPLDSETIRTAQRAVTLADASGDAHAIAVATHALHDAMWVPGSAGRRLPVIADILEAATSSDDADLVAEAHLLRAAALLELGDPAGREELATYISLAEALGHARGRWGALTRRATLAQIVGRAQEAAELGVQAYELGRAIGVPDALACFCTSRWSLVALGVPEPQLELTADDPLWPMFPIFRAWPHAVRKDLAATTAALGDFSVLDIAESTGTEGLAAAAVVLAVAGSTAQLSWVYERLLPWAGTHVVVTGCASYHAAVDHHLGALAAALGDTTRAEEHFRAALAMHERLGAAAWTRLTADALAELAAAEALPARNEFRLEDGRWQLRFGNVQAQLPDSKGLQDIAMLIDARGAFIHVSTLVGNELPRSGADPVLDRTAKANYKTRLDALAGDIQDAEDAGNAARSDVLRSERDALIHALAAAAGLGGRPRRLGDQSERARKTVSARVRDALGKIDQVHPPLAEHLHRALRMGTACSYVPDEPTTWKRR